MPASVSAALVPVSRGFVSVGGQFEGGIYDYLLDPDADVPDADVMEAARTLDKSLLPCPPEIATRALTAMRMRTKGAAEASEDTEMRLALFAADLTAYPADVVIEACRFWGRNEKWFPSWAELREILDRRVQRRRAMRAALDSPI